MKLQVHRDSRNNPVVTVNGERIVGLFKIEEVVTNHSHVLVLTLDADDVDFYELKKDVGPAPEPRAVKRKTPRRKK